MVDCEDRTRQSPTNGVFLAHFKRNKDLKLPWNIQRAFQLDIINIQDKGQERWKKKYVYWIPALHLEGKEIAKGRWDEQTVNQALKQWDQKQSQTEIETTDKPQN
jgi:hypothetical protein